MFLNGYPYTDFHEMNLDFLLQSMNALKKAFSDFTASNSLIFAEPLLHDISKSYAKNTIVLDSEGNSYISLQAVPVGVQLSDSEYWLMVFNFEDYTEKANKNFTVNYFRDTTRSDRVLSVGDWLVLDDILYKVTAAIAVDDLFEVGVNIEHFTVEQFLKDFITSILIIVDQYRNQLAQDVAATTSNLQAQLTAALSGATVDSEVINARVTFDNVTYTSLGEAERTQFGNNAKFIQDVTGIKLVKFEPGYYNNRTIGDIVSSITPSSTFFCGIVPYNEGDIITVNLYGGTAARAWAFLDEDYKVLQCAASAVELYNVQLPSAPAGTAYVCFNNWIGAGYLPYGYYAAVGKYPITSITDLDNVTALHEFAVDFMQSPTYIDGKFLNSNGELSDNASWMVFEHIPVHNVAKLYVSGQFGKLADNDTGNIWCYDINKKPLGVAFDTPSGSSLNNLLVDLLPNTAYISITTLKVRQNLGHVYANIAELSSGIDNTFMNYNPNVYKKTARIFRKVVCCGDSFTSGHIVDNDNVAHPSNVNYAWPHYMSLITGNEWDNCGRSGANVWSWLTASNGLAKAASFGKSQAYVIGFGINDSSSGDNGIPVGTTADIGTENQTFYAGLSKIVRELNAISPNSKIFLQTCPRTGARYEPYNEAIEYIATFYHDDYNTHLIDLLANIELYNAQSILDDSIGNHFTGIGYEQFAEILFKLISEYINDNITDFQDVFSIDYDQASNELGVNMMLEEYSNIATNVTTLKPAYVTVTGKCVQVDGYVYFNIRLKYIANISASLSDVLSGLPAPDLNLIQFNEYGISDEALSSYIIYTSGWAIKEEHTAGQVTRVFGRYKV